MDLDEYIFYEKKKDKNFSRQAFADKLGISLNLLCRLMILSSPPTSRMAYKIEKITEGKVSGWHLITKYMEKKENE